MRASIYTYSTHLHTCAHSNEHEQTYASAHIPACAQLCLHSTHVYTHARRVHCEWLNVLWLTQGSPEKQHQELPWPLALTSPNPRLPDCGSYPENIPRHWPPAKYCQSGAEEFPPVHLTPLPSNQVHFASDAPGLVFWTSLHS